MGRDSVANNPSVNITQIRSGSVVTGNLKSKHSIRVDGNITGDLICDEKIIVGVHGEIGGNLSGTDITIEGFVQGDVLAKGSLHIHKNATIEGAIYSREISIEKGGQLNGQIAVGKGVEVPDLDSKPVDIPRREVPMEKPAEQKKAAGDNYGTVAW